MDIRKRKLKGYVALSILLIVCMITASAMTFYTPNKNNENIVSAATLGIHSPSALFLNGKFSDIIEGEQKEYIYFGSNSGAAIKWRVLTTNSGYSTGNMLLWADTSLGDVQYNEYYDNPNYVYWGTSKIRATLNGGKYLSSVSNTTAMPTLGKQVQVDNSWYKTLFSTNEQASMVATGSYSTKDWGTTNASIVSGETGYIYATTSIVGTGTGQYGTSNVSSMNSMAITRSAGVSVSDTSVIESASGDYLFLLDYYDINNKSYGFYDPSDNKTYAEKINTSWTTNSNWYPGYNDAGTNNVNKKNGSVKANYFVAKSNYWLRPGGLNYSAYSCGLVVFTAGNILNDAVSSSYGVRPAFNFNSEKVIYATASSNGKSSTFSSVNSIATTSGGKPAYKVYTKTDDYTTYSDAKITVKDDKLSVEKSGASGSAIILLADKSGSGVVEYQATANFNGSGVATATLPSGVNPRDYSITVLFTDGTARGSNYAESIKGSCTVLGHTIVPQEKAKADTIKYKYYSDTNEVTFDLENVYDKNIVDNSDWVDITIDGKGYKGDTITVADSKWSIDASHKLTFNVSEVGDYTVKIKPKSGNSWADGTTAEKTYKYTLKYKVKPLAWDNNSASITKTYNGGDQYLLLRNYDEDIAKLVTITPTHVTIPEGQTNAGKLSIKVKDYAKEEKVTVALNATYKDYLVWDETDYPTASKELQYTVNKKALNPTLVKIEDWKTEVNIGDTTYDLWIDCFEEDIETIKFEGYYKKGNEAEKLVAIAPTFAKVDDKYVKSEDGKKYKLTVTLPEISEKGNYKYILKLATQGSTSNNNYSLTFEKDFATDNKSVNIKEEDIVWQYRNTDLEECKDGKYITVDTKNLDSDSAFCVTYNGKEFSLKVDTDSETSKLKQYASDVDFNLVIIGNDDKEVDDKTIVTDVLLKNNVVTYYTVKLTITAKEGKTGIDLPKDPFTFRFKINKAKFDLSSVVWDYDPKQPKEYNGGKNLEVKLTGFPAVLVVDYYDDDKGEDSNINSKVCEIDKEGKYKPYTAKVTFKFNDKLANIADIKRNYILPNEDDASSYICKDKDSNEDKDFPWKLEWIVKKAEIDLAPNWEKVAKEDKNNVVFRPFEISDKTKEAKIEYEYYKEAEWDNVNCVVIGNATPKKLTDIVVDLDSEPEKYWVVAKVNEKNSANYEIKKGTEAKKFTVGAGVVIDVDMDKEFMYDGKEHGVKNEFKFNGKGKDEHDAIADIKVKKYYLIEKGEDGEENKRIELADGELPTKAGTYIVSIDFEDEEYQDNFALSKYNITFEIKQAELVISLDGNKNEFEFNGEDLELKLNLSCDNKLDVSGIKIKKTYYEGTEIKEDGSNRLADGVLPKNVGKYIVVLSIDETDEDNYRNYYIKDTCIKFDIEITPYQITAEWNTTGNIPTLKDLNSEEKEIVEYVYTDSEGNVIDDISTVEAGNYKVIARIKSEYAGNYVFV
ncbi:MAG: hypothetical protein HDT32_05735, partial [Clostridiales bacterium]|nr:hypothetical protein [Clostridiales bacterium]